jgi:hypothetical protein
MPDSKIECFLPFERAWIKSVDFGVRRPEPEISRIVGLVRTTYNHGVLLRRSVFHQTEYALEYEPIPS